MISTAEKLSQKEKEFVAAAASIASGCLPCTSHHIKLFREAGATEAEICDVIEIALRVRNNVTQIMAKAAQGNQNHEYPKEAYSGLLGQPLRELVSLGAALACNSTAGVEVYLSRAREAGATTRQIKTAALLALAIREEAANQAETVFERMSEPTGVKAGEQPESCCKQSDNSQYKCSGENITLKEEKQ